MGHALFDPTSPWSDLTALVVGMVILLLGLLLLRFAPIPVVVPPGSVGVVTLRPFKVDKEGAIVKAGQPGTQPELLPPGRYFPIAWQRSIKVFPEVVVPEGAIGVVTAHIGHGEALSLTMPYRTGYGVFANVAEFLPAGGQRGVQEAVLGPGRYPIHPYAFEVLVATSEDELPVYGKESTYSGDLLEYGPDPITLPDGAVAVQIGFSEDYDLTAQAFSKGSQVLISHCRKFIIHAGDNLLIEWSAACAGNGEAEAGRLAQIVFKYFAEMTTDGLVRCSLPHVLDIMRQMQREVEGHSRMSAAVITEFVFRPMVYAQPLA